LIVVGDVCLIGVTEMSKEKFVIDTILKLAGLDNSWFSNERLNDFNPKEYGISRATAWRCLKELEKAGYVEKATYKAREGWLAKAGLKSWRLTPSFRKILEQQQAKQLKNLHDNVDRILTFNDPHFTQQKREQMHTLLNEHLISKEPQP